MPWFAGTAFLHSIMIQEKRGMLRMWNMALIVLTFSLTILGTFTRSGIIESVHVRLHERGHRLPFLPDVRHRASVRSWWRSDLLTTENRLESFVSVALLFNNLLLLGIAFAIWWGTFFHPVRGLHRAAHPRSGRRSSTRSTGRCRSRSWR